MSILRKLGQVASKDPSLMLESLTQILGESQKSRDCAVRGALQLPEKQAGMGSGLCVIEVKLAIFPWEAGTAQGLWSIVVCLLIAVGWTFLHDWTYDQDTLILEFAHNLLLDVKEKYVNRMKGIMEEFLSKIIWENKKNKTLDKALFLYLCIHLELMLWIQSSATRKGVVTFPWKWLVSCIIQC